MRNLTAVAAAILLTLPVLAQGRAEPTCRLANATYELVEQGGERANASLAFRPFDSVMGLAATMTTTAGDELEMTLSASNGYVVRSAEIAIGDTDVSSIVEAYTSTMERASMSAEAEAPEYILLPQAGFEAYMAQRGQESAVEVPEGAWRLRGCQL